MPKKEDLIGKTFSLLTVIGEPTESHSKGKTYWHCKCQCGNECDVRADQLKNGGTKSCGCLQKKAVTKDYTNQIFGRLIALEPTNKRHGSNVVWKCKCSCGNPNFIYVDTSNLVSKTGTKSCGCLLKERDSEVHKLDLVGKKFGKLTVIEETSERLNTEIIWLCQCECGNITKVRTSHLTSGDTSSCGCLKSKGEAKIISYLQLLNIQFEKEKIFQNCKFKNGASPRFDFYLPKYNLCIEYDGIQHFQSSSGWNTEEKFLQTQQRDEFKNNWCKENNIKLIRIPYTDYNILNEEYLKERINNGF